MSLNPADPPVVDEEDAKDRLLETVTATSAEDLPELMGDVHPALLADVLEAMPPDQRLDVWEAADQSARGEALTELHDDVLRSLAAAADPVALGRAMAPLQPDEIADLEPNVPPEALDAALSRMGRRKRASLERVRHYPGDVAGGLMDVDAVTVPDHATLELAAQHLRRLRADPAGLPEHLDSVFVVSEETDRLLGVVTLADLVTRPGHLPVTEVMATATGLTVTMPVHEVVQAFRNQDLVSAPVVSADGVLLGRITVDDVVDVITEAAERSILAPAGLAEDRDLFAPLHATLTQRGLWLGINLGSAFLAAGVVGRFETTIEQLVALAVLMPVVASMGGVAGQQSLALVIRGLALNQVGRANRWRLVRHEMRNGVAIGGLFALVVAAIAFAWYGNPALSGIIALALIGNVFIGTTAGTIYPFLLKRMNIDPALAGGMVLTATTDVIGFFSLLALGALLLF